MRDLYVVLHFFPGDAIGHQANRRRLAVVVLQIVEHWPSLQAWGIQRWAAPPCSQGPTPAAYVVRLVGVSDHYRAPGWFTRNVFNQLVAFLTRQGISVLGSRVLAVKGRTSGQWRTTPVNLLTYDDRRYLVAPRGETQWVRNLRVIGTGELRLGRRAEGFRGRELTDDEKVPVLRAYLKRWKAEVGVFFEGVGPDSGDDQIRAIAPKHPAFEVLPVD